MDLILPLCPLALRRVRSRKEESGMQLQRFRVAGLGWAGRQRRRSCYPGPAPRPGGNAQWPPPAHARAGWLQGLGVGLGWYTLAEALSPASCPLRTPGWGAMAAVRLCPEASRLGQGEGGPWGRIRRGLSRNHAPLTPRALGQERSSSPAAQGRSRRCLYTHPGSLAQWGWALRQPWALRS